MKRTSPGARSSSWPALLLVVGVAAPGCTGNVGGMETDNPPGQGDPTTPVKPGQPSKPGMNTGGTGGTMGPTTLPPVTQPPGVTSCKSDIKALPPARVWRLSATQYINTVKAQLGIELANADVPWDVLTSDGVVSFSDWEEATVQEKWATVYEKVARQAAQKAVDALPAAEACITAKPAAAACVTGFVKGWTTKAFRRAPTADEQKRYEDFYKESATEFDGKSAARMTIEAVLQAPAFVYRTEIGTGMAEKDGSLRLSGAELASQLSYLIADAPPSAELLALGESGKLTEPATVKAQATALLETPSAKAKINTFLEHWLHLGKLAKGELEKDATKFPMWESVKADMLQETQTFLQKVVWEERGDLATLFSAPHSWINNDLAKLYGIPTANTDKAFKKVPMPDGQRSGLLGQAALLASLSNSDSTSPVHRGLFYFQTMLCNPLPPVPPDAASMASVLRDPNNAMGTEKEHFEYAKKAAPACSACHAAFMPMGFGLENFDPIGAYRDTQFGKKIDPSVESNLPGLEGTHKNGMELAKAIAGSALGQSCFVRQFSTYAFGRAVEGDANKCEIESVLAGTGRNLRVQDLVVQLTQQPSFYYRRTAE